MCRTKSQGGITLLSRSITIRQNYSMIGSDYSAQEPRILAAFSQDPNFLEQLQQGKDPYATIAVGVYHNKYEDNLEFYEYEFK